MAELISMPRLSDSMEEGEIVAWHKKVGDAVGKGDLLAEINSDKATMDFESPMAGSLLYIGVAEGGKVIVGAPLAIIGKAGEAFEHLLGGAPAAAPVAETAAPVAAVTTSASAATVAAPVAAPVSTPSPMENRDASTVSVAETASGRVFASPLAKEIAKSAGLSIQNIQGSGDNGRIVKRDVEAALSKGVAAPAVAPSAPAAPKAETPAPKATPSVSFGSDSYEDLPLSSIRKTIAKRLSESMFTAPHFYLTMEINMDKAVELRPQLNAIAAPVKISFNDLVVKAAAVALRKHPVINSSWLGDAIRQNHAINVGVAVAVGQSLFVPVVRHADMKSLGQISSEVRTLAGKAKEGKLQLPEMQGNTFTISNLGMFDIEEFTAIINPPDSCILAVGSIIQKPIVNKSGEIVVGNMMKVTLSCDHRVVDGATGAQFLQELKAILEEPIRLLV